MREPKAVEKLVGTACEKFGRLDIMFNNAGIGVASPLLEASDELYSNTLRIESLGTQVRRQSDDSAKAYDVNTGDPKFPAILLTFD